MRTSARSNPFFDTRSVLLFAAISMGGAAAMHAHAAGAKASPPAAANPANATPAMAQSRDAPPMPTSPAFGPRTKNADKGTGAADKPDERPEIKATEPSALPASGTATGTGAATSAAERAAIPATRPTSIAKPTERSTSK